jgi:hypothetical protein
MMDRGTVRNMQFYSKNKSGKLVHLVGFIIRIYPDAQSPERQICFNIIHSEYCTCCHTHSNICTQQNYTLHINSNPPTCSSDQLPSSGTHQYKGIYNINISISHVLTLKYKVADTAISMRMEIYR